MNVERMSGENIHSGFISWTSGENKERRLKGEEGGREQRVKEDQQGSEKEGTLKGANYKGQ